MTTTNTISQTAERQEIKDSIDSLSEWRLEPAEWFINFIIASRDASADETDGNDQSQDDPVERLLANAPLDDEEVTDEDLAAFTDTDEDFRTGNTYTQEEVERELGLQIGNSDDDVRGDAQ